MGYYLLVKNLNDWTKWVFNELINFKLRHIYQKY
jgi:hypothetical protein